MSNNVNVEAEKAEIKRVVESSIGWAATKDKDLVYSCFAHDEELFYFSPEDAGTLQGFEAFKNLTENFFMLDDFKAIRYEVKELVIHVSPSGDAA